MGSCLSKKSACSSSSSPPPVSIPTPQENPKSESQLEKTKPEDNIVRKDIFIIKHRKSHEIERQQRSSDEGKSESEKPEFDKGKIVIPSSNGAPVRTSSCTKEEVDAILIQCGRLSRSSSAADNGGRKYSGSKRSYDFDGEGGNSGAPDDDDAARERERRRHSQGRRRTPSRERDQQRSGSRERSGSGGGRRVSRSPGRRSESPITTNSNSSAAAGNANSRPGKMVSVPAIGGEGNAVVAAGGAIKRIQVKRNVSPRARSPARARASNENQQQPMSLSRNNSRKAEHSPYRRNPLSEIDTNIISQKPNAENKTVQVVSENRSNNLTTTNVNSKNQHEQQQPIIVPEETTYGIIQSNVGINVISSSGPENPKTQTLTRSRSSRLSRDLDINPETLLSSNPNNNNKTSSSYTALLLEDIHNFHQKNSTTPPPPAFTLPPCVTKACSILEAVADLNSSTGSNLSSAPKRTKPEAKAKDPILESEVAANDDLTEPSFHKYVTVRRGTSGGEDGGDMEEQESSGSNSFAGSQQHWVSSSTWEPNSAESTDRWASSSSSSRPAARQGVVDENVKKVSGAKKNGIGRGRMGTRSSINNMAVST
ncbi:hypothetical protein CASFOL_023363 [Castilleja foliolosa]|uniref:Uncharacterized protein n=1 Tax=Castilleja foliolosa TaxID=1961234 RepID=A0ABD3CMG9_9LAMI